MGVSEGQRAGLRRREESGSEPGHCAAAIARATARGSIVIVDRIPIGEMGFIGIITDTEGNSIGLHSMV